MRRSLALFLVLPLLLAGCAGGRHDTIGIPLSDQALETIFAGIYEAQQRPPTGRTPHIPVLIVPHHLTAAVTIAAGIRVIKQEKPRSILLLSPDHFNACPSLLCTANVRFESPLGATNGDDHIRERMIASPLVTEHSALFRREHGISAVIPFLTHTLPKARITPLAIAIRPDWKAHREEILALLEEALHQDATLIVSTDFSHYLPLREADDADEKTAKTLFAKDFDGIAALDNPSQSDCPACLWLAAKLAEQRNAYNPSVLLHTNSARLLKEERAPSTTSHFAIAFYENARISQEDPAFAGDVTVTRARENMSFRLSPEIESFWKGSGPRIVNLEGPLKRTCTPDPNPFIFCNALSIWQRIRALATHWSVLNNHSLDQGANGIDDTRALLDENGEIPLDAAGKRSGNVQVFALTKIMNPVPEQRVARIGATYDAVIRALRSASGSDLPSIVYVHSGTEYRALASDDEIRYLHSFVDAGADAVLVVHSHVVSDMEIYRGAPIFRGLGNFVFDQRDRIETQTAKLVRLRPASDGMRFETITEH